MPPVIPALYVGYRALSKTYMMQRPDSGMEVGFGP